jgi:hypothetical protein
MVFPGRIYSSLHNRRSGGECQSSVLKCRIKLYASAGGQGELHSHTKHAILYSKDINIIPIPWGKPDIRMKRVMICGSNPNPGYGCQRSFAHSAFDPSWFLAAQD